MTTLTPQRPNLTAGNVTPTFTACTAADKFAATQGTYMLYYRNGGTATAATSWVLAQASTLTSAPAGSKVAASPPTGATTWSDAQIVTTFGSSADVAFVIDDVTQYVDTSGFVNLKHNGTLTTLTVAVFGPY